MRIHEGMSTGVVTGRPMDTLRDVVVKTLSRHCGAIPIVNAHYELLGIVTPRDVMLPMYPNYGDSVHDAEHGRDFLEMEENCPEVLAKEAEEIMARNPLTVAPQTPIPESASYMGLKNLRRIPVAEHGKLVGMVGIDDIHRGIFFARGGCEPGSAKRRRSRSEP